jgi:hypothetical protein
LLVASVCSVVWAFWLRVGDFIYFAPAATI